MMQKRWNYWDAFHKQIQRDDSKFRPVSLRQLYESDTLVPMSRILVRDFIHNSLYHPKYGYFSKHADIFRFEKPVVFKNIRDSYEFLNLVGSHYKDIEQQTTENKQIWHTPTELFRPYYGHALAKHILNAHDDNTPLQIYEMGAGNGTLMLNILDYLSTHAPQVYRRMRYNIIEISPNLAQIQSKMLSLTRHASKARVVNKSIFEWDQLVQDPCFFVAMEVLDNFSHDLVRYDVNGNPLEGVVMVDETLDFTEALQPMSDPLIKRYLASRDAVGYKSPCLQQTIKKRLQTLLPVQSNVTEPEFVPTMQFQFLEQLKKHFPNHRLLISDFDSLSDTIPGHDAPVVQTRYQQSMVACTTYLVQPGLFDIFFPTNFELFGKLYTQMCQKPLQIMKHADFMTKNGDLESTRTRSGENPMVSYYQNASFVFN
ncbi:S-adenosyl-L-methionine-dependent methyltransferase, partial [Gorgonomyces haynaldii]